mmetsp:Transcript_2191/g.6907  ORF Transcript_2191/g.6907 Transcript_2191/m.6907 type:complete len:219 (+) Transcript_2191:5689-6345(+)
MPQCWRGCVNSSSSVSGVRAVRRPSTTAFRSRRSGTPSSSRSSGVPMICVRCTAGASEWQRNWPVRRCWQSFAATSDSSRRPTASGRCSARAPVASLERSASSGATLRSSPLLRWPHTRHRPASSRSPPNHNQTALQSGQRTMTWPPAHPPRRWLLLVPVLSRTPPRSLHPRTPPDVRLPTRQVRPIRVALRPQRPCRTRHSFQRPTPSSQRSAFSTR